MTLKMYFVCEDRGPQWFYSYGILSNGFCFGEHLCSHPDFAPGDLYFRRKERIAALREMFGLDPDTLQTEGSLPEMFVIKTKADIPEWWGRLANTKEVQDELKPLYERYRALLSTAKRG
jgi:hypothetical protein